MTTQTHQPVAYQIEDANGEFMCLSRTKSTIRGATSKPLYDESALAAERTARIEAQQRLADMQELANSCLDKVAHDLIQEMKPRMRDDVQAAYQAMVKAKAAKMMKALEKVEE